MFRVNSKNTGAFDDELFEFVWPFWRRSSVFIVNFEHISHIVLVFLLLGLNM